MIAPLLKRLAARPPTDLTRHLVRAICKEPLPPPITNLLACCVYGAGCADDFNQAKAIVAVRTHCLAVA